MHAITHFTLPTEPTPNSTAHRHRHRHPHPRPTSCCSQWSPAGPSPCRCRRRNCGSSAETRPWTRVHWTHCHLNHCCSHPCHQPGQGLDKAGAAGPQVTALLQDKKVLRAWGLLPLRPLLRGRSCLGHAAEDKAGKVKRPLQVRDGAFEAWTREVVCLSLRDD